jgi:recombination associated protein RdgC
VIALPGGLKPRRLFEQKATMLKNLVIYCIASDSELQHGAIEEALCNAAFTPCLATQQKSFGWITPRGAEHGAFVEVIDGQWIMKFMTEQRVVPGSVLSRRVDEIAEQVEQTTGRKPGKKLRKELKDQALLELLPMAFTKRASTTVWINPKARLLIVGAPSLGKADDIASAFVKTVSGSIALQQIHTNASPAACMAAWLTDGIPPAGFSIDRECELKSCDEIRSVVKYGRHRLDTEEVRQHILTGKVPTKLAMSWRDRISFVLSDTLMLKKITLLDVVMEGAKKCDEAFDADVAIFTGEVRQLIPELLDALGGELVAGAAS